MDDQVRLQKADQLFKTPCRFMLSVANLEQLPEADRSEVAFLGRSNVGKSSLINALFSRRDIAKTSSTPGRTQQLNYFDFLGQIYLVDLPGYGYAKAPQKEVRHWQNILKMYLRGRPNLRRVFLLIDSRIGLKSSDEETMKELDTNAVPYQIVLTKTDKISSAECVKTLENIQHVLEKHPAGLVKILTTSSEKKIGLSEVRAEIADFCE